MSFIPSELIRKKRAGDAHSQNEIRFMIQSYARDELPDYQISAWLMAICLRGMNQEETAWLTQEMRDSGVVLDLSHLGVTVDKHSTGGIGDKTSLILAPLVAAAGVPVPMMAGRGLGHTGGTLDKLESIRGFNVRLEFDQFKTQLASVGAAIIGQTKDICPADRKLYALRDVTGTVDSLPLICGSIMSKKLAEGMSALVLDVKFGSGAFMKTLADAEGLALALRDIGARSGKRVTALLTNMNEPLGRFVGNALEVHECLQIMRNAPPPKIGKGWDDTIELTVELAGHMIALGGKAATPQEGKQIARDLIRSGAADKKFGDICAAQGGDLSSGFSKAKKIIDVEAAENGFMNYVDLEKMGMALVQLGGGRRFQSDKIDEAVGFEVLKRHGEQVARGEPLFHVHLNDDNRWVETRDLLLQSFKITAAPSGKIPLIAKVIS